MGIVKDFFRETFVGYSFEDVVEIDEIPEPSEEIEESSSGRTIVVRKRMSQQHDPEEFVRLEIIVLSNRVLAAVFLCGVLFILVYPFAQPERKIPDVVQNVVSGCIGYFGSVVTGFLGKRKTRSRRDT